MTRNPVHHCLDFIYLPTLCTNNNEPNQPNPTKRIIIVIIHWLGLVSSCFGILFQIKIHHLKGCYSFIFNRPKEKIKAPRE